MFNFLNCYLLSLIDNNTPIRTLQPFGPCIENNRDRNDCDRISRTRILAAHFRLRSPYTSIPMGLLYCCFADQMPLFSNFMVMWLNNTRKFPTLFLTPYTTRILFFPFNDQPITWGHVNIRVWPDEISFSVIASIHF